jgi:hypothetical protein
MQIKQKYLVHGARLFLSCLILLLCSQASLAQDRKPAAELIALTGTAEIKSPGDTQFRPAKIKDAVYQQDQFRTLANSRAKLFFRDESILVLTENTTIDIANFQMKPDGKRQSALMKLIHGSMRFIVSKVSPLEKPNFEISGTTAVMGIRGTDGIYETHSPDTIFLHQGRVSFTNRTTGQSTDLNAGQFGSAPPGQPNTRNTMSPQMWQQRLGNFNMGQALPPPTTVTTPTTPVTEVQTNLTTSQTPTTAFDLGNPLVGSSTPNQTLNPGAQNGPTLVGPLPVVHAPQIPR